VIRALGRLTAALVLVLAYGGMAAADEAKTPLSAAMILNIMSAPAPVDSRKSAFDEALKRPPVPVEGSDSEGEVLPDGSVRYGRTVVTVRNPCPPGTSHWEPPPLPGRRSRLAR
jgi:hypothetical protein